MIRSIASMALVSAAAALAMSGGYKYEAAGAPPSELAPAIAAELQEKGHKILSADGKIWCEVWLRKATPKSAPSTEADVTWKTIAPGTLVGAIRWPAQGSDRRGAVIKPGVHTLRFGVFPLNGDHQGVAPQRDFLVLAPAASDDKADPVSKVEDLMNLSRKSSGNAHPAVLSMWLVESGFEPGLSQAGEHDWVLQAAVGDAKIALILVGKAE